MSADKYVWLAKLGVSQQSIKDSVSQRVAGGGANAKSAPAPQSDKLPQPMTKDCKVVHGKVRGPKNHVLCSKHGHVLDIEARTVIAIDLADYAKRFPPAKKDGPGANA